MTPPRRLPDEFTFRPRAFIDTLRPICEIIFDLMLNGYIASLEAYHHSVKNCAKEWKPKENLDKWERAIISAHTALGMFRGAETKRRDQLIDEANAIVQKAMKFLKDRYGSLTSSRIASHHLS